MTRDPLVKEVGTFLRDLEFEAYWPNEPMDISDLETSVKEPSQVEIDIVARIKSMGFLIEVTTQKEKNEAKIKKFISKYRAVRKSALSVEDLISLFSSIPSEKKENFCEIKEWRSIYIGTSLELVYKELTPDKFTDSEGLTIINIDDWSYITTLKKAIGEYAQFEFLSFLGLNPDEVEGLEDIDEFFEFYKVEGRNITSEPLDADIFLFAASPSFLLRTCRVYRFAGLSLPNAKSYYQRMLSKRKLDEITDFIDDSSKRCFPTPITVVLPKVEVRDRGGEPKLAISLKYGSLDIIDGQHRLYAFTSHKIPEKTREEARILVNGIKFNTDDLEEIKKFSARTFIDINRKQQVVKTSLLYSISYDVLGDTSSKSLAGKIISLCNSDKNSPLHDLFEGRVIDRKSKLGLSRTSIVEVTNALAKIIEKIKDPDSLQSQNVAKMLGIDIISSEASELIEVGKKLMNRYFNRVRNVLPNDWRKGTKTIIFYSKFMAALIRLLLDSIEKGNNFDEIEERLRNITANIKSTSQWEKSGIDIPEEERDQIFYKKRGAIPSAGKIGTGKIFEGLQWYESNNKIWPELGEK
jgi:DGQHR domain-containing protein